MTTKLALALAEILSAYFQLHRSVNPLSVENTPEVESALRTLIEWNNLQN
jgi:hypothetical protein